MYVYLRTYRAGLQVCAVPTDSRGLLESNSKIGIRTAVDVVLSCSYKSFRDSTLHGGHRQRQQRIRSTYLLVFSAPLLSPRPHLFYPHPCHAHTLLQSRYELRAPWSRPQSAQPHQSSTHQPIASTDIQTLPEQNRGSLHEACAASRTLFQLRK